MCLPALWQRKRLRSRRNKKENSNISLKLKEDRYDEANRIFA